MSTQTVKERPILFSAPMIGAILNHSKTMTRRVIKPQPDSADYWYRTKGHRVPIERAARYCPYGQPGDRLWVRETWCHGYDLSAYRPPNYGYRADYKYYQTSPVTNPYTKKVVKWHPSIFMSREASRIDLDILNIRVERVQDISGEDAWLEGIDTRTEYAEYAVRLEQPPITGRHYFKHLWDSINAKPKPQYARTDDGKRVIMCYVSYPWEAITEEREHRGKPWYVWGNPWVWVIGFAKEGRSE